jgi:hypothetical protein
MAGVLHVHTYYAYVFNVQLGRCWPPSNQTWSEKGCPASRTGSHPKLGFPTKLTADKQGGLAQTVTKSCLTKTINYCGGQAVCKSVCFILVGTTR